MERLERTFLTLNLVTFFLGYVLEVKRENGFWSLLKLKGYNNFNHCGVFQASLHVLDENSTQLWWAGKELQRGKKLQDFIGKNEKTKLICKLQR